MWKEADITMVLRLTPKLEMAEVIFPNGNEILENIKLTYKKYYGAFFLLEDPILKTLK
jgi:hypothetical protein